MDTKLASYPGPAWSQSVLDRVSQLEAGSHSVDGVTIKLDENKVASVPYMKPATSVEEGVGGLVPNPVPISELLPDAPSQVLTNKGWCRLATYCFIPSSIKGQYGNTIMLGGRVGERLNLDEYLEGGVVSADVFDGTLPPLGDGIEIQGGRVFNLMQLGDVGEYYGTQLYYRFEDTTLWARDLLLPYYPGVTEAPTWTDWALVNAPKPTSFAIPGQVVDIWNEATGSTITLPAGGIWMYYVIGLQANAVAGMRSGVAPGGTSITVTGSNINSVAGFAYRVL